MSSETAGTAGTDDKCVLTETKDSSSNLKKRKLLAKERCDEAERTVKFENNWLKSAETYYMNARKVYDQALTDHGKALGVRNKALDDLNKILKEEEEVK